MVKAEIIYSYWNIVEFFSISDKNVSEVMVLQNKHFIEINVEFETSKRRGKH